MAEQSIFARKQTERAAEMIHEASSNINSISSAVEDFSVASQEIAFNVANAASISNNASDMMENAGTQVLKLGENSGEIGKEAIAIMADRANYSKLPLGLVAMEGSQPVGMVFLKEQDLGSHPHLTPWLAGLYVDMAWRGRGIGTCLVQAAERKAAELGLVDCFYLPLMPWIFIRN